MLEVNIIVNKNFRDMVNDVPVGSDPLASRQHRAAAPDFVRRSPSRM
ncbi:hypothetical protein PV396_08690 [Streptomyces sp. ME02-8801-2C]|nr:hypothetical protein [Streptomyces sp. ME02-8801-2C]MDX3452024.1 hypothetical protein [Streptomyces sp. ME02-8801-2C]